ncbi:glycosyltransferase family 4 protein [Pontibacter flavimaris]|uniref:Group 1 glycosyl transferase n=1 Tax=Pontibacter flavimaris TaxID=1797110 RepID=A0A1Q5PBJ0_9BACT|nr:glycosyltransferase family 4 protein [Pontibacter flavimaris]OKL39557.1 group 1 glycosyl transferase [Pontibacter flavimaris]
MARFLFFDDQLINILQQQEKPSGGAAVQTLSWIRGLTKVGQEVFILTRNDKDAVLKEDCKEFNIIPLYDIKKGVRWIRWGYYRLPYLYNSVKQVKPDYLYQSVPGWASFFMGSFCHLLNIKYLLRISNDNLLDKRINRHHSTLKRRFLEKGIGMAYCILCQNEYQLDQIRKKYPHKRAIKIPNPILLNPLPSADTTPERNYIAWVGLFQYQKNLQLLFEIACTLTGEQFKIAGKELPNMDVETELYLNKLRELPNVEFTGFLSRKEIPMFLTSAKYLLNTSHYEGFSNTFLEAMAVGTPIISSDKVNPDGFILKNKLGIIYRDPEDLVKQLNAVSAIDYGHMSANSVTYVLQHHDHEVLAKQLLQLLNCN